MVDNRGEWQLPRTFFLFFLAKVIEFSNCKNTYNYIVRANLNPDSPKINFKIYLLPQFLRYMLETWKLCSRLKQNF